MSGFAFLNNDSEESTEQVQTPSASSGFSFMMSGGTEESMTEEGVQGNSNDTNKNQDEISVVASDDNSTSAFSFMSPTSGSSEVEASTDKIEGNGGCGSDHINDRTVGITSSSSSSAFSFIDTTASNDDYSKNLADNGAVSDGIDLKPGYPLSASIASSGDASSSVPDFLSSPNPEDGKTSDMNTPQEIKLGKASSTSKGVKKKRRATKVGYAREEDMDADEEPSSHVEAATSTPPPTSNIPIEVNDVVEQDDEVMKASQEQMSSNDKVERDDQKSTAEVAASVSRTLSSDSTPDASAPKKSFFGAIGSMFSSKKEDNKASQQPPKPTTTALPAASFSEESTATASTAIPDLPSDESAVNSSKTSDQYKESTINSTKNTDQENSTNIFAGLNQVVQPATTGPNPSSEDNVIYTTKESTTAASVEKDAPLSIIEIVNKKANDAISKISDEFMEISAKHCQLTLSVQKLTNERVDLDKEMKDIANKVTESEEEQQNLAQLEEFEKADALSSVIDDLRRRSKTVEDRIHEIIKETASCQLDMNSIYEQRSTVLDHIQMQFNGLLDEQDTERVKIQSEKLKYEEEEDERLKTEEERVELEMTHVDKEASSLAEEAKVIEDAISSQTTDLSKTREEYEERSSLLNSEIEELEKSLVLKKKEQSQLDEEIATLDSKVKEVRKKYDRQLTRIEDRQSAIDKSKTECEQERSIIKAEREKYVFTLAEQTSTIEYLEKWKKAITLETDIVKMVKHALIKSNELKASLEKKSNPSSEESSASELDALRSTCSTKNTLVQKALSEKSTLEHEVKNLQAEEVDISEKMVKLEAEKKAHATARRFKEAGVVAKDMKDLAIRVEVISEEITSKQTQIADGIANIDELQKDYDECLSSLHVMERDYDLKNFDILLKSASCLHKVKMKIQQKHPPFDFNEEVDVMDDDTQKNECTAHYLIRENSMRLLESELDGLLNTLHAMGAKHGIEVDLDGVTNDEDEADSDAFASQSPENGTREDSDGDEIDETNKEAESRMDESANSVEKEEDDSNVEVVDQKDEAENKRGEDEENSDAQPDDTCREDQTDESNSLDDKLLEELQSRAHALNEEIQNAIEEEDFEAAESKDNELQEINSKIESIRKN